MNMKWRDTSVTEGKAGLQLLDGGLRSSGALSPPPAVCPSKESADLYQFKPYAGELSTAFNATEGRLRRLLEDRSRIGRDLHDSLLQSLYAIGLNVEMARRVSRDQTTDTTELNDRIVQQINQLIHEVRGMIRELESGTVQEFDLSSELSTLCTVYEQSGRLQVKLDLHRNAIEVLTSEEEREILNIVREALSNCVRHAHATQVAVSIRMKGTRIRISIHDDGIGFTQVPGPSRGYGLTNMETRAKRLGGTLRVQSRTGKGTQIMVEFSLEPLLATI